MFGPKLSLITAILMTLAALAWIASAIIVPDVGESSMSRWLVAVAFAIMAVIYWVIYSRRKGAQALIQNSGTE